MLAHRVSFFLRTIIRHTKLDQPGFYSARICAKSLQGLAACSTISTSIAIVQFTIIIQSTRVTGYAASALSHRRAIPPHLQPRGLSRRSSTMASTSTGGNDDISYSRPQQSPLASQRGKQNAALNESNQSQVVKSGGLFPLGFKEGFSQWVWNNLAQRHINRQKNADTTQSGQAFPPLQQSIESCRTFLIFNSLRHRPNQAIRCPQRSHRHHWCPLAVVKGTPPQKLKLPLIRLAPANGNQAL